MVKITENIIVEVEPPFEILSACMDANEHPII